MANNRKPIPPDFPQLPEKLRKIAGESEMREYEKKLEEWRIQNAMDLQRYVAIVVNSALQSFQTKTILNLVNAQIIYAPFAAHPTFLLGKTAEQYANKLICQNDQGIFIVQPALGFNRVAAGNDLLFDDGILAASMGAGSSAYYRRIKRVAESYVVGNLPNPPNISGSDTKNVIEVFSPSYAPIFLGGFADGTFSVLDFSDVALGPDTGKLGYLGGGDRPPSYAAYIKAYSRSIPFVKNVMIAPMSTEALLPSNVKLEGEPNIPVFLGWKDMNAQSARWTPTPLLDGQWWDGGDTNENYTYSLFEQT